VSFKTRMTIVLPVIDWLLKNSNLSEI